MKTVRVLVLATVVMFLAGITLRCVRLWGNRTSPATAELAHPCSSSCASGLVSNPTTSNPAPAAADVPTAGPQPTPDAPSTPIRASSPVSAPAALPVPPASMGPDAAATSSALAAPTDGDAASSGLAALIERLPEPERELAEKWRTRLADVDLTQREALPKLLSDMRAEHGAAPDEQVRTWQRRIEPVWMRVAGGCHLTRQIPHMIESSGFRLDEVTSAYSPGPRFSSFVSSGVATPR